MLYKERIRLINSCFCIIWPFLKPQSRARRRRRLPQTA
jgi:hypothetical protein